MDTMETKKYQQGGEANMPSSTELQQEISKQLKEGVQPTEIVAALLQAQIPEQEIIIAFERLGVPENEIVNMIGEVSAQLESQPSPEEMAMMEQQQMPIDPNSIPEGMMPPQVPMEEQGVPATPEQIAQLEQQLPQASMGAFIPPHQRGLNQKGIGQGGGSLYLPDYGTDQQTESDILNLPKMPRPLYNNVMMHQNPLANLVTSIADFGQTMFSKEDRDGDGHSDGIFRRDTKEQRSVPGYKTQKQEWRDNKGAYQKHIINAGLNPDGTKRSEADFKENYIFDQTNKEVLSKDEMNQRFVDNSSVSFDEEKGRYNLYAADNKRDHRRNIRKQDAVDWQEFSQRIKDNPDQAKMLYDYYGSSEKETGIPTGTTFGVDKDGYGSSYAPGSVNPYFSQTAMYENTLKRYGGSLPKFQKKGETDYSWATTPWEGSRNITISDRTGGNRIVPVTYDEFNSGHFDWQNAKIRKDSTGNIVNRVIPYSTSIYPNAAYQTGSNPSNIDQVHLGGMSHGGENLMEHDSMQKDLKKVGPEFLQAFMQVVDQGTPTHTMPDGTYQNGGQSPYGSDVYKDIELIYPDGSIHTQSMNEKMFKSGYIDYKKPVKKNFSDSTSKTQYRYNPEGGFGIPITNYKETSSVDLSKKQGGGENASNLWDFYEGDLPSIEERADLFKASGLGSGYTGTASENKKLLDYLKRTDNIPLNQELDEVTINFTKKDKTNVAPVRPPSIIESSLPEPQLMMDDQSIFSKNNPNSIFYNPASEEEVEETATENSMIGPANNNVGPVNNSMLSNTDNDDDTNYSNLTTESGQLTANLLEADNTNLNVDNDPSATFNQVANMGDPEDSKNNVLSIPPLEDDDLPVSTIDYDGDGVNDLYPKAPMVGPQNQPPGDDPEKDLSVDPSVVDSSYGDSKAQKIRNWTNRQLDRPGVQKFGKFSEGVVNVADAATDFLRYGKFLNEKNDKMRTQADKTYGMVAASDRGDQDENTGYFIDNKVVQMGGDPFNNLQQMLPPTPTTGEADVNYNTLLKLIAAGADIEIL